MSGVPDWMVAIAAEQERIAARFAAPAPEVTPEPWERQQDILVCYPLRADWEQIKIMENANGAPQRRYQNNWEDYWKQYGELVAGTEPYPEPLINSRGPMALTFPMPAPVMALNEFAREAGWDVRTRYAQGYPPHGSTGRPTALRDSIALRFGNHPMTDRAAYACYEKPVSGGTWAWSGIMIWGPDLPPFAGCGATELKEFLSAACTMPALNLLAWVRVIRERNIEAILTQRLRNAWRVEARQALASFPVPAAWPAALLAVVQFIELAQRGAMFYTPEEIGKLLAVQSKKTEKETSR